MGCIASIARPRCRTVYGPNPAGKIQDTTRNARSLAFLCRCWERPSPRLFQKIAAGFCSTATRPRSAFLRPLFVEASSWVRRSSSPAECRRAPVKNVAFGIYAGFTCEIESACPGLARTRALNITGTGGPSHNLERHNGRISDRAKTAPRYNKKYPRVGTSRSSRAGPRWVWPRSRSSASLSVWKRPYLRAHVRRKDARGRRGKGTSGVTRSPTRDAPGPDSGARTETRTC